MPLPAPAIDDRRYQDLLNEALARISVHTPEWTNLGPADPGVTMIEVFAFLTENLLYRANQIPERNRNKFIELLGVPLSPAASARGLVAISNENGSFQTITLKPGEEVRAGQIPFRTEQGLDVIPVEARLYLKRPYEDTSGERKRHYNMLYASLRQELPGNDTDLVLYETVAWNGSSASAINLGDDTVDGCLWLALLARKIDMPSDTALAAHGRELVRKQIAGKTLSLGIVPALDANARRLQPKGSNDEATQAPLAFEMPRLPAGGKLPQEPAPRVAEYRHIDSRANVNLLEKPGIVELTLPSAPEMELCKTWTRSNPAAETFHHHSMIPHWPTGSSPGSAFRQAVRAPACCGSASTQQQCSNAIRY